MHIFALSGIATRPPHFAVSGNKPSGKFGWIKPLVKDCLYPQCFYIEAHFVTSLFGIIA